MPRVPGELKIGISSPRVQCLVDEKTRWPQPDIQRKLAEVSIDSISSAVTDVR